MNYSPQSTYWGGTFGILALSGSDECVCLRRKVLANDGYTVLPGEILVKDILFLNCFKHASELKWVFCICTCFDNNELHICLLGENNLKAIWLQSI